MWSISNFWVPLYDPFTDVDKQGIKKTEIVFIVSVTGEGSVLDETSTFQVTVFRRSEISHVLEV